MHCESQRTAQSVRNVVCVEARNKFLQLFMNGKHPFSLLAASPSGKRAKQGSQLKNGRSTITYLPG